MKLKNTTLASANLNSTLDIQISEDCDQTTIGSSISWRYITAVILLISMTLILSGCATPIRVEHVDIQTAHSINTASALSTNAPSEASSIVLRRHNLLDKFEVEPVQVVKRQKV